MPTPSTRRLPSNFFDDALPFKIDGDYCKLIPLTKGQLHVVDVTEYERLSKFRWQAFWSKGGRTFYAWHFKCGLLHRFILRLTKGDPRTGDHIDPSRTWDNRRRNLRLANRSQQVYNTRISKRNKSGYKGVCWSKQKRKYMAQISTNGRVRTLGFDSDPAMCAEMYRVAAIAEHGEFARID